ncbi:MAG: MCP four helix bundle domain-containing protein, partial [Ignavibacteriales bacterium]|nr:MCP four helix bundle domain-containing protein [Ignavibacteriales bacterium]
MLKKKQWKIEGNYMKFENLKIGTQLKLGFIAMLFFVTVLGLTSFWQSAQIHEQTDTIYQHPMQVRRAVSTLETDLLNMQIATRDLLLADNDTKKHSAIERMEIAADDVLNQFRIIKERYLGSQADVDEAYRLFIAWRTARAENTKLALEGKLDSAKEDLLVTGVTGMYREKLMAKIYKIDSFAKNKSDTLYNQSNEIMKSLNERLFILIAIILLLSILINYILLRNIRKPLQELTDTTHRFHNGDQSARSTIQSENELGALASSFNSLADSIQENFSVNEKIANISGVIVAEDDAKKFFHLVLGELARYTDTQMSAVYLLTADKSAYEHFVLIGTCESAKQSFSAGLFEGEFGLALSSRKMQHIKNIPEGTRFVFETVQGNVIPREMITIPVLAGNEVVAVISLASIKPYSLQALKIIEAVQVALSARVTSILAYQKMKSLTETLKEQNSELEIQKTELATQSSELTQQNVALELQKQQLNDANRQKTIFLSNMSHELRTPLNSVIALSGVLNRRLAGSIPDEEHSYLEVIERNGKNLLALINDILDISRIESGRIELDINVFNGNSLVTEIISM